MRRQRFDYSFWIATQSNKSDAAAVPVEFVPEQDFYFFMRAGTGVRVLEVKYVVNSVPVNTVTSPPYDLLPGGAPWRPDSADQDIVAGILEEH